MDLEFRLHKIRQVVLPRVVLETFDQYIRCHVIQLCRVDFLSRLAVTDIGQLFDVVRVRENIAVRIFIQNMFVDGG